MAFLTYVSNCDWQPLYCEYHPDVAYSEFSEFFCRGIRYSFSRNPEKSWKKKKKTFKPIGNQEYSEVLEKETNCEKNPRKKGLNDSEKTFLKKLTTLPRNCTVKINLQSVKII